MATSHNLGFPNIGEKRELKKALEAYWNKQLSQAELLDTAKQIREKNWAMQQKAGIEYIPVGNFSLYDHVLDTSILFGVIDQRFKSASDSVDINLYFRMARGQSPDGKETTPCEMTKWFDTNYHHMVTRFHHHQTFEINSDKFFSEIDHAKSLGHQIKPVLLGPLSFLWLGKCAEKPFDKLTLLDDLLVAYKKILKQIASLNIPWVQIDEPILTLDLTDNWKEAFNKAYHALETDELNLLLTTYFGSLTDNLDLVCQLPTAGLHIDVCSAPKQLQKVISYYPANRVLSVGIVNGRNIWKNNLAQSLEQLKPALNKFADNLWIAPSCSLLHSPVNLDNETQLDESIKSWLAFAKQKVNEVAILTQALNGQNKNDVDMAIKESQQAIVSRKNSTKIHNALVKARLESLNASYENRQSPYELRARLQKKALDLPVLPTTTIGSFPQTSNIRQLRRDYKHGQLAFADYQQKIRKEIADVIAKQEALDLDVLVHGEAERNDMVEYFGELLNGFAFTENAWVQSYGSRCVKPPIIYGDVSRSAPMTVEWIEYAKSLTDRPVKGMLTGPTTILAWSFVRDDQPASTTALQIALALRDEVADLEAAGIKIIQIDEPAFREKLPLRKKDWDDYIEWSVRCFRIASAGAKDSTQIHTHMCYSEFNDIIESIAALDADVITIESSRSDMELLKAFEAFAYPNEIGPGVYDIHSPRIPSTEEIADRLKLILNYIGQDKLWVNPDCGLKTRQWPEVEAALHNMVEAAKKVRKDISQPNIKPAVSTNKSDVESIRT